MMFDEHTLQYTSEKELKATCVYIINCCCCLVAKSCPTLQPCDCSLPGSHPWDFWWARILGGLPFIPIGVLRHPGIEPPSPTSQVDLCTRSHHCASHIIREWANEHGSDTL